MTVLLVTEDETRPVQLTRYKDNVVIESEVNQDSGRSLEGPIETELRSTVLSLETHDGGEASRAKLSDEVK